MPTTNRFVLTIVNNAVKLLTVVCLLSLVSCHSSLKKKPVEGAHELGGEIEFPSGMMAYSLQAQEEVNNQNHIPEGMKIVSMIDASCGTCLIDLYHWDQLVTNNPKIGSLPKVLVFHAEDNFSLFKYLVQDSTYKHLDKVWLDNGNQLRNLNNWPGDHGLQTFLLDANDKVLALGNPNNSEEVLKNYLSHISE